MTCRPTLLRIESVPVLPQKSRAHPGKSAKSRIVKTGLRYILLNGCSPPAGKVPVHLPVECTPIFPACQRQKVVEQKPRAESCSGHNVPFPMPPAPAATPGTFRRVQGTGPSCAPPVPPAHSTSPYQLRLEAACASRSPFSSSLSSAKALEQVRCSDFSKPIGQFPQILPWAHPVCRRLRRRALPGASSRPGCEARGGYKAATARQRPAGSALHFAWV